jgi:hypothetical protein
MRHITLVRDNHPKRDKWLVAVSQDYEVPEDAHVFVGEGLHEERVAFWIGPDGGGFGALDKDPEGYIAFSEAMKSGSPVSITHYGVDEWVFEPGQFDYNAKSLKLEATSELF